MPDAVNPTVRFHMEQTERLLRSLKGSTRTYALFAALPIALAIVGFLYGGAQPASESETAGVAKLMSTLIPLVSAYPLALIQSKKGHIVVLNGFHDDLGKYLHSPTLTEEINWVIGQIKSYVEKWLSGGTK
jgi:hypothetical protein